MIQSKLRLSSQVSIKLYNESGELIGDRLVKNVVTTVGKSILAGRAFLSNSGYTPAVYIDIGTNSRSPAVSDTGITSTSPAATRQSATFDVYNPYNKVRVISQLGEGWNKLNWTATFNINNPNVTSSVIIREAGIFTAPTGGSLFARTVFDPLTKGPTDTLTISWTIQMTPWDKIFTITGLGSGKRLTLSGLGTGAAGIVETFSANGSYLRLQDPFAATVATQPTKQLCTISGTTVTCVDTYYINVSINNASLLGTGSFNLKLTMGDGRQINTNVNSSTTVATFQLAIINGVATPFITGNTYAVTSVNVPTGHTAVVTNGSGTIGTSDVTNIVVTVS